MTRPWPVTDPTRGDVLRARTVTAVLCAAFDPATDEAVLAVRARLAGLGVALPERPPHRPHLTLAAVRVPPADLPQVVALAVAVAARHRRLTLGLSHVGRFGRAGALWLGPAHADVGVAAVRALQVATAAELAAATAAGAAAGTGWHSGFPERSTAAGWVPHCTLATRLRPELLRRLQTEVSADYRRIDAGVTGLAVILVGGSGDVATVDLAA